MKIIILIINKEVIVLEIILAKLKLSNHNNKKKINKKFSFEIIKLKIKNFYCFKNNLLKKHQIIEFLYQFQIHRHFLKKTI